MIEGGNKFLHTLHPCWLAIVPAGRQVDGACAAAQWLRRPTSVEEKVDGPTRAVAGGDGRPAQISHT